MGESVDKIETSETALKGLATLPIAQPLIGKVEPCTFRIGLRKGEVYPAPECLPTSSEIGEGR